MLRSKTGEGVTPSLPSLSTGLLERFRGSHDGVAPSRSLPYRPMVVVAGKAWQPVSVMVQNREFALH